MSSGIGNIGQIAGNTHSVFRFGIKSSIAITTFEDFSEFLKSCESSYDFKSNIIEFGQAGPNTVTTEKEFTVDKEKVKILLHHSSFNFGIEIDGKNVIINLKGNEKVIPKSFFTKANLALATKVE